jgi:hypothetical protein
MCRRNLAGANRSDQAHQVIPPMLDRFHRNPPHRDPYLTGDYLWRSSAKIGAGKFRPLRSLARGLTYFAIRILRRPSNAARRALVRAWTATAARGVATTEEKAGEVGARCLVSSV